MFRLVTNVLESYIYVVYTNNRLYVLQDLTGLDGGKKMVGFLVEEQVADPFSKPQRKCILCEHNIPLDYKVGELDIVMLRLTVYFAALLWHTIIITSWSYVVFETKLVKHGRVIVI